MPKSLNQKGAIPFLVPLIIGALVIGGVFLISKNPKTVPKTEKPQQNPQTATNTKVATSTSTPTDSWKTYKVDKYGYSIKYPQSWVVDDLSSEGSQLIRVKDDQKSAFVLIETIIGPSLAKTGDLEQVLSYMEDKVRKNTHLKIAELKESANTVDKDIKGYVTRGEETYENKTILFEERFQVGKNGRGIRMHSAYTMDSKTINKPINDQIIASFKALK